MRLIFLRSRIILTTILIQPFTLFAVSPADTSQTLQGLEPSWGQFLKVLFMLAVVVALIWVSLALLKKVMGGKGGPIGNVDLMGGVPLGTRKSVQFMQVGDALYVIGVTDHHISLLSIIKDKDEIENILNSDMSSIPTSQFSGLLKKFIGKSEQSDE